MHTTVSQSSFVSVRSFDISRQREIDNLERFLKKENVSGEVMERVMTLIRDMVEVIEGEGDDYKRSLENTVDELEGKVEELETKLSSEKEEFEERIENLEEENEELKEQIKINLMTGVTK